MYVCERYVPLGGMVEVGEEKYLAVGGTKAGGTPGEELGRGHGEWAEVGPA